MKKIVLDPKATEFDRYSDLQAIRSLMTTFKEMAEAKTRPKDPKPNDIMASALSYLTFGDKFIEYQKITSKVSSPKKESKREGKKGGKKESKDDRLVKRNETMVLLIDNLFQALAVASTPIIVLDGDEKHNKSSSSFTDLQIQTIVNGFIMPTKVIADTKKDKDALADFIPEIEKAATQLSAQYNLKVRDEVLSKVKSEKAAIEENLRDSEEGRKQLNKVIQEKEDAIRKLDEQLTAAKGELQKARDLVGKEREEKSAIEQERDKLKDELEDVKHSLEEHTQELEQLKESHRLVSVELEEASTELEKESQAHQKTAQELLVANQKASKSSVLEERVESLKKDLASLEEKHEQLEKSKRAATQKSQMAVQRLEQQLKEYQKQPVVAKPDSRSKLLELERENMQLKEDVRRLEEDNRRIEALEKELTQLRRDTKTSELPKDVVLTNTLSNEQVQQFIDDIISHHEKVSSRRHNVFGKLFHGAHHAKRTDYFNQLLALKDSSLDAEAKKLRVTELTKHYVEELANGKSVRYLSDMIRFFEGESPSHNELQNRWGAVNPIETLDIRVTEKMSEKEVHDYQLT